MSLGMQRLGRLVQHQQVQVQVHCTCIACTSEHLDYSEVVDAVRVRQDVLAADDEPGGGGGGLVTVLPGQRVVGLDMRHFKPDAAVEAGCREPHAFAIVRLRFRLVRWRLAGTLRHDAGQWMRSSSGEAVEPTAEKRARSEYATIVLR